MANTSQSATLHDIANPLTNDPGLINSQFLSEPSNLFINYSLLSLLNIINSSHNLLCSPISDKFYILMWESYTETKWFSKKCIKFF